MIISVPLLASQSNQKHTDQYVFNVSLEIVLKSVQKSNINFNFLLTESVRGGLVVNVCRGLIWMCSLTRAMQN